MRESNRVNRSISQSPVLIDKDELLRQAVEQEYTKLYRQNQKTAQKKARELLKNVQLHKAPVPIELPIPIASEAEKNEQKTTVSVVVADGANRKIQNDSISATVMPTLPIVRELISYVPTTKNLATRGNLIAIPYLGDHFDAEDQHLINSLSVEPSQQNKPIRKKKLDENSLEEVYQILRSKADLKNYKNQEIVEEILHFHRDSKPLDRLLSLAQVPGKLSVEEEKEIDVEEFVIKRWCSKFCPRCFSYNCFLHKEGPSYLKLPKKILISTENQTVPCGSNCYKNIRETSKRSISPTADSQSTENVKKRPRKSSNAEENKCLISIENSSIEFPSAKTTISTCSFEKTDRALFRLFYFLFDGDFCSIRRIFDDDTSCHDLHREFLNDSLYFSQRLSKTDGETFSIRRAYRRRMPEGTTRTFLNYMKKFSNRKSTTLKPAYQPCSHDGPCSQENLSCRCMQMGTFCEKFCNCSADCPHRFPGCACKGSCLFNNCLCTAEGRECDADLCHNCGASYFPQNEQIETAPLIRNARSKSSRLNEIPTVQTRRTQSRASLTSMANPTTTIISCTNISLQRKIHKQVLVAESDVAGYGAFLGSAIAQPGDLIAEYIGEIITEEEADRRGRLYDKRACSYLFNLDMQHCIDARQFGNKLRFANHSSKPNCVPKIKLVNGDYRIGIYAKEVIFQGDELFFEYMYDADQLEQFVNNERVDEAEQENLNVLKRYPDNFMLVQPWLD